MLILSCLFIFSDLVWLVFALNHSTIFVIELREINRAGIGMEQADPLDVLADVPLPKLPPGEGFTGIFSKVYGHQRWENIIFYRNEV